MQEEIHDTVIGVVTQTARMTASELKKALEKYLDNESRKRQETIREKKQIRNQKKLEKKEMKSHGKQSIRKLTSKGAELHNIEVSDQNIKSFDRVARKYGIDYALKKDVASTPPKYYVFFKAKDVDVMTAAFKEYTGAALKKQNRQSIRKKLQKALDIVAKQRELEKTKKRTREAEL